MTTKMYSFNYYCKTSQSWIEFGSWFKSESEAKAYAESLKRDYPDVMGEYMVIWDMR